MADSKNVPAPACADARIVSPDASWPIISLLLFAAALRIYKLNTFYWVDELYTRERGGGSLWEALTSNSYPLVDVMAWFTTRIYDTEWVLRVPSVLAGVAGVGAMYGLGRKAHSRLAGLLAALMLALSPFHLEHSQNARYYAFIALIATLALGALLKLSESVRLRELFLLTALTALGLFTHPFYALAGAGMFATLIVWHLCANHSSRLIGRLLQVLKLCVAGAVGFLPLALVVGPRLMGAVKGPVFDTTSDEAVLVSGKLIHHLTAAKFLGYVQEIAGGGFLGVYVLAMAAIGLFVLFHRRSPIALATVLLFAGSLPLFFIQVSHFYDSRYFTYLLPIIVLSSGVGLACLVEEAVKRTSGTAWLASGRNTLAATAAATVFLASVPAHNVYYGSQVPHDSWGFVAKHLSDYLEEGDVVFLAGTVENLNCSSTPNLVLEYYANCFMPAANRRCWVPRGGAEEECLLNTIKEFPSSNIWIAVTHSRTTPELSQLILDLCGTPVLPGRPALYLLPGATRNLIADGGFEEGSAAATLPEGCGIVSAQIPDGEAKCLLLHNAEPDASVAANLSVAQDGLHGVLDGEEVYTLSLNVRLDNVRRGKYPTRVFKVCLQGQDAQGESFWEEMFFLRGSVDWKRYILRLVPGRNLPLNPRNLSVRIGLFGATGTAWVDNVQLERSPHATSFTEGTRPPHLDRLPPAAPGN